MWFELQTLNWKIRRRTKAPNGGYQTRLRLWCVGACRWIPWAQGCRVLEAFHRLRRLPAGSSSGLEALSFFSGIRWEIDGTGASVGLVSTPQSKKTASEFKCPPPSISLPRGQLWCERSLQKYWFDYQPAAVPVWVPKSCLLSAAQLRCIFIFVEVCRCHWRGRNHQYSCLEFHSGCPALGPFLSQLLNENILRPYGRGILIISGGVSGVGRRAPVFLWWMTSRRKFSPSFI